MAYILDRILTCSLLHSPLPSPIQALRPVVRSCPCDGGFCPRFLDLVILIDPSTTQKASLPRFHTVPDVEDISVFPSAKLVDLRLLEWAENTIMLLPN